MKIINYKYGYLFDCSIHGKIIVSQDEMDKFIKYINHPSVLQDSFWKRVYKEDLHEKIKCKNGYWINLRTTITGAIVNKFGTEADKKKYKVGNYMFEVKPA